MSIYLKQTQIVDEDSGYCRFLVEEGDFSSDSADVVTIEFENGKTLMFELVDDKFHVWSHSFDLELIKPIYSTARIKARRTVM